MRKNQSGFAHLFLVVIVVIGIGGLFYYSGQKGLIKTTSRQESSPTPTTGLTKSKSILSCNDIKTFSSNKLNISFDCPKDMLLFECDKDVNLYSLTEVEKLNLNTSNDKWCENRQGTIQVWIDNKSQYNESVKSNPAFKVREEKINIDGQSAIRQRLEHSGANIPQYSEFVTFSNDEVYYRIRVLNKELLPQFDQILSTFEFIDSATEEGWQTYTNSEHNFIFNYPSNYTIALDNDNAIFLRDYNNNLSITVNLLYKDDEKWVDNYNQSFYSFASWFALQQCAADGPGMSFYCDKVTETTNLTNANGLFGIKLYLNLLKTGFNLDGSIKVIEEKSVGPVLAYDVSDESGGNLKSIMIYNESLLDQTSNDDISILQEIGNSLRFNTGL